MEFLTPFLPSSWDLSSAALTWLAVATFVAAFVRSFSGFGFALMAVPSFLLVLPPAQAIPLSIAFDLLIGLVLLPSVLATGVAWRSVRLLMVSAVPFLPLGLYFSKQIPASWLQAFIGGILFFSTLMLMSGFRVKKPPSALATFVTGGLSGFLGGVAGMFGPPVILFYMSSPLGHVTSRASMMAFFLVCLFLTLGMQISTAADYTWAHPLPFLLPLALLGTYLGHKKFLSTDEMAFRRIVFLLILGLSLSLLVKAFA